MWAGEGKVPRSDIITRSVIIAVTADRDYYHG